MTDSSITTYFTAPSTLFSKYPLSDYSWHPFDHEDPRRLFLVEGYSPVTSSFTHVQTQLLESLRSDTRYRDYTFLPSRCLIQFWQPEDCDVDYYNTIRFRIDVCNKFKAVWIYPILTAIPETPEETC